MPIEGFDYKAFTMDMVKQLQELLSQPGSAAVPDVVTNDDMPKLKAESNKIDVEKGLS